ncbi:MAG: hypothetical protein A2754_02205 [Candidatus Magasanikbacteria bacterium RIFCSPHIGHO2_01_FULL_47_8]|uniref:Uncharacterized protein n=1 Tax=Candidatus Magasanikbacteria bacterium RIFCSPHIGHO2_01_FULL_47_8 TaxID=1798673 RepID=A0A1F6MDU5_9BACT|nr:MAG: hypothetical protein A2754_02205 [Candidatus Magasanikbacteria bacterium RIFCSPHIGHO2_01_FULL_47_8]
MPTSPVDLIPKRKSSGSEISDQIISIVTNVYVSLSFVPVILFSLLYGVLYFYSAQAEENLNAAKQEVAGMESEVDYDKKTEVERFAKRLDVIEVLLSDHMKSSKAFAFIESITHRSVAFNTFKFIADGTMEASGQTVNYTTLGEQIIAWENNKDIEGFQLEQVSLADDGTVSFKVIMQVIPAVYKEIEGVEEDLVDDN